jgi:hypothetical protein
MKINHSFQINSLLKMISSPLLGELKLKTITNHFYPLANEVAKGYSNATVRPSHPCEHSRINVLQWILTKLGTYLVLKRILNPIDFQGHRSKVNVTGSNFYRVTSL